MGNEKRKLRFTAIYYRGFETHKVEFDSVKESKEFLETQQRFGGAVAFGVVDNITSQIVWKNDIRTND